VSNVEEAEWVLGAGLDNVESLTLYRIIPLDTPANSEFLYRQGYPNCHFGIYQDIILST
jgi:hypothetical protein